MDVINHRRRRSQVAVEEEDFFLIFLAIFRWSTSDISAVCRMECVCVKHFDENHSQDN